MSVHVQGLCFKARFKCPKRKAVAVAMADHAHDDGTSIWPSVARLAAKTEWSERTVQRVIRELQTLGILVLVEEGGHGAKSTNEFRFDMDLLFDLCCGAVDIVENEGDHESPCTLVRVTDSPIRVSTTPNKGAHLTPEPSSKHKEPSGAQERASDEARAPAAGRPVPQFDLTPDDVSWDTWMTWLSDNDRRDVLLAAQEARGMTVVGSKWPTAKSVVPRVNHGAFIAKRKTGEAA